MNVLIVDDSTVMRRVLAGALERCGITNVDQAADGLEAVTASRAKVYDLVLMDWNMPNMLGIDAVRAIRADGRTMPIIMVTTEAEKSKVIEALRAGATSFIIKPFEPKSIIGKIREILDSQPPSLAAEG